jgi:alpha-tubulin suppressor-like RCC1 family protein
MGGDTILTTWCAAFYNNGKVYTAGTNLYGQLGDGSFAAVDRPVFAPVIDYNSVELQNVEKIWYCYAHAFVKLSVGDPASGGNNIFAWGDNSNGGLGLGSAYTAQPYATPSGVFNPFNEVTKIVGGDGFSIVLYADGTVESTGQNNYGQLGNSTTTDTSVFTPVRNTTNTADLTGVVDIGATYDSAFAVLSNGDILLWGRNTINTGFPKRTADPYYGLLVPSDNTAYFTLPTLVGNYPNVYSIPTTPIAKQSAFLLRNV